MEAVVKSSSALRTSPPTTMSRCDEDPGSTEDGRRRADDDGRPDSSKGWKATDSRLCWKGSSRTWTARRSAGSPLGELSPSNNKFPASNNFCRSMSYDRLAADYLSGQWPRAFHLPYDRLDSLPRHGTVLTADKWTQTDSNEYTSSKIRISAKSLCLTSSNGGGRNLNFVERKLASKLLESDLLICDSHEPLHNGGLSWSKNRSAFIDARHRKILTTSQGSDEGFNQEVEKLIQCTGVLEPGQLKSVEVMVPDGHRAPIAELLSMGCPNGRILSGCPVHSDLENYFVRIISEDTPDGVSIPPLLLSTVVDCAAVSYHHSSSARNTSGFCQRPKNVIISPCPVVCRSSCSREAPEGSEVEDKMTFDVRPSICSSTSVPSKLKALKRYAIPSERSAFCPLSKKCVGRKLPLTLSLSPSTKGNGIQ